MSRLEDGRKSRFVTVVGSLFLCLSGFGTVVGLVQAALLSMLHATASRAESLGRIPPIPRFFLENAQLLLLTFVGVCSLTALVSINLLRRKNWARLAFVAIMVAGIGYEIVGFAMYNAFIAQVREVFPKPELSTFDLGIRLIAAVMALGFSAIFVWIITKLLSPRIAAEFRVDLHGR